MHKRIASILAVWIFISGPVAMAGTIYTWTDADGVKRFSNFQPPEGTENVETIEEVQTDQSGIDRARQEYDQMVKKADQEADRQIEAEAREKAKEAETERNRKKAQLNQQMEKEREKLQKQIEALRNRGLSRTFSDGQRASLIEKIQEKIDRMESDPEAYFNH
jgi:cell division protein FtsN